MTYSIRSDSITGKIRDGFVLLISYGICPSDNSGGNVSCHPSNIRGFLLHKLHAGLLMRC
jgi:hypothetical protein